MKKEKGSNSKKKQWFLFNWFFNFLFVHLKAEFSWTGKKNNEKLKISVSHRNCRVFGQEKTRREWQRNEKTLRTKRTRLKRWKVERRVKQFAWNLTFYLLSNPVAFKECCLQRGLNFTRNILHWKPSGFSVVLSLKALLSPSSCFNHVHSFIFLSESLETWI